MNTGTNTTTNKITAGGLRWRRTAKKNLQALTAKGTLTIFARADGAYSWCAETRYERGGPQPELRYGPYPFETEEEAIRDALREVANDD